MRNSYVWLMILCLGLMACATAPSPSPTSQPLIPSLQPSVSPSPASGEPVIITTHPPQPTVTGLPPVVPAPTVLPLPQWDNPLDKMMQETAVSHNAPFHQLLPSNSGVWQYDSDTFLHPIALAMNNQTAFLLDGGRILALDLLNASPPQLLLQPGDVVAELRVQEPLDLALLGEQLLVLDRTGDVYRLDLQTVSLELVETVSLELAETVSLELAETVSLELVETVSLELVETAVWQLERYERPIGETSSHYFVALGHDTAGGDMRLRLETSYSYANTYFPDERQRSWSIPEDVLPVDISGVGDLIYLLWRNEDRLATVALFQETGRLTQFSPTVSISQPRQIIATETAVYILDMAGKRLLNLHPVTGALQALFQLPSVTAFAAIPDGSQLLFAGKERLYFWQQPTNGRFVHGGATLPDPQPHDTAVWQSNTPYAWPITGNFLDLTRRDLQMPGAPRHYRLGVHQGTDFYWASGTPVYAVAAGTVIRATLDYERPSEQTFNRRRAQNIELGYTKLDNLDFYRGRQIWILQGDGFVARYAHLSEVAWDIVEGTAVTAGQQIGSVGNSGSPASINSETADAHLHFELWLDDVYLGQYLRPIETRELVEQLFTP